ncbi:hypothetical protein D3C73_1418410 [compost metagenome]
MQELGSQRARQDRQVGLHMPRRQVGRGAGQTPAAGVQPGLAGQFDTIAYYVDGRHDNSF